MFAVLITGAPGVGKSEVASRLHDILGDDGAVAALIEVDQLERSYPPLERERSLDHLRMLATSYRELGAELLLVTATIEDEDHRRAALEATAADDHLLVLLRADPETLRERILAREAPGWSGLPELLDAARLLARSMPGLSGIDVVIGTDDRRPGDVAASLAEEQRRRGWDGAA
jgi:predicted kinase